MIKEDMIRVTGGFNLHDIVKDISVDIANIVETKDDNGVNKISFATKFDVKRSDYGITYLAPLIGDKVEIELFIEAVGK